MREPTIWREKSLNAGCEVRGHASEKERTIERRRKGGGKERRTTSFLVCILITSFCRKLLGIRDTQPRLGFSARTHPRVPAAEREREVVAIPSLTCRPRRERWSVGRECRSKEGEEDRRGVRDRRRRNSFHKSPS